MVFQRKKTGKSTALSVRAIAAQVILQVLDQGKSLSTLLPDVQSQVKPQDLPLLQEITFGICRVLPRLENIIKKVKSCSNVYGLFINVRDLEVNYNGEFIGLEDYLEKLEDVSKNIILNIIVNKIKAIP